MHGRNSLTDNLANDNGLLQFAGSILAVSGMRVGIWFGDGTFGDVELCLAASSATATDNLASSTLLGFCSCCRCKEDVGGNGKRG